MKYTTKLLCVVGSITISLVLGCAPAYHSYSGCYVNCQYCPPPPLPYTHYNECVCHSCAAQTYLQAFADAAVPSDESSDLEALRWLEPDVHAE